MVIRKYQIPWAMQYKSFIGYPFVLEETYPISKSTLNLDLPYDRLPYKRFALHILHFSLIEPTLPISARRPDI